MCKALLPLCGFCVPTFLKELFVGQANEDSCPFLGGQELFGGPISGGLFFLFISSLPNI